MFNVKEFKQVYLFRPFVDFRKGINGLTILIQEEMQLNPFEKNLFIFCCQDRKRVKVIYWDDSGFALWHKRLEEERFIWPSHLDQEVAKVDIENLLEFLKGFDPWQSAHKKLNYQKV
jgi:transposase